MVGTMRDSVEPYASGPLTYFASLTESVVVIHAHFKAFEGPTDNASHIRIALNTGRTGSYTRSSAAGRVDATWRRNGITVGLPDDPGYVRTPALSMIGLSLDWQGLSEERPDLPPISDIERSASQVSMDAVAARIIRTLPGEAELHACSSAYFTEKLALLLGRLAEGNGRAGTGGPYSLDAPRLRTVQELMKNSLGSDLKVSEMARAVQMDPTNFSKAFRAATGLAPFAYMTRLRMQAARDLLCGGQSVTTVALSLNYSNPSKFAGAFRRHMGYVPSRSVRVSRCS